MSEIKQTLVSINFQIASDKLNHDPAISQPCLQGFIDSDRIACLYSIMIICYSIWCCETYIILLVNISFQVFKVHALILYNCGRIVRDKMFNVTLFQLSSSRLHFLRHIHSSNQSTYFKVYYDVGFDCYLADGSPVVGFYLSPFVAS